LLLLVVAQKGRSMVASIFTLVVLGIVSSSSFVQGFASPAVQQHRSARHHDGRHCNRRKSAPGAAGAQLLLAAKDGTATNDKDAEAAVSSSSSIIEATTDLTGNLQTSTFSYVQFAKSYPFANNLLIATTKTAAADLLAQVVIAQTPVTDIDWQRSFLFCLFGCLYLGAFQYAYQVQVFKRLFDVDRFTQQTWSEKLRDKEGLQALAAQTVLDLTVLTVIYLPTFYIFKAAVFGGGGSTMMMTMIDDPLPTAPADPVVLQWLSTGLDNYRTNFAKDEADLIKVWLPADLVCFSVPLYLRLPVRHVVSFVWTAYLSFVRGGH
jgi:hypothetical protein